MKNCCAPGRKHQQQSQSTIQTTTNEPSLKGMVLLEGGSFTMGTDSKVGFPKDGEGPARKVVLDPFYVDVHAVSNEQFQQFITETGYITEAEKFGWSFVFHTFVTEEALASNPQRVPNIPWWLAVGGATWNQPEGPGSDICDRMDHPVIHVSWHDAKAYADWAGKRLPTEAEWEYAARGGLEQNLYAWGNELIVDGKHQCNIWQGDFPNRNTVRDGHAGTAPVDAYEPNGLGLYNVCGNVWEWCSDWFSPNVHLASSNKNPNGPDRGHVRSMRGGSYLCHKSYCNRYRVAARSSNSPDSSTGNIGFRCVVDIEQ
ncbi:formylglycine-generating enzyme family protein [Pseudalkalibacillus sp. Hm43]|uniref:formylglycine-generating enzyme family protein n=1 Tax=Pseudalkalibacillus sp. Hm43 TaxID=3450742 RepID=UPI003F42E8E9